MYEKPVKQKLERRSTLENRNWSDVSSRSTSTPTTTHTTDAITRMSTLQRYSSVCRVCILRYAESAYIDYLLPSFMDSDYFSSGSQHVSLLS